MRLLFFMYVFCVEWVVVLLEMLFVLDELWLIDMVVFEWGILMIWC